MPAHRQQCKDSHSSADTSNGRVHGAAVRTTVRALAVGPTNQVEATFILLPVRWAAIASHRNRKSEKNSLLCYSRFKSTIPKVEKCSSLSAGLPSIQLPSSVLWSEERKQGKRPLHGEKFMSHTHKVYWRKSARCEKEEKNEEEEILRCQSAFRFTREKHPCCSTS